MLRIGLLVAAGLALAGCVAQRAPETPSFYRDLGRSSQEQVDVAMAARLVSGHRRNHGLGPVEPDSRLSAVAQRVALEMARADDVRVASGLGPVGQRVAGAGYRTRIVDENVSAGYRTLAEAFSGWRASRPHDAVMRLPGATRLGIATVTRPDSRFRVYWALVMAGPDEATPPGR